MKNPEVLKDVYEQARDDLRGIAYRMLGSVHEADDAMQELWLRVHRTHKSDINNASGWLRTVLSRVCIDMLRARRRRLEVADTAEFTPIVDNVPNPAEEATFAESVGLAVCVVLDRLRPAERVAFVLHEMLDLPFAEIASVLGKSTDAAKKLASRARSRVYGATEVSGHQFAEQQAIVEVFLAATRSGDVNKLLQVLAPDVVRRADAAAIAHDQILELRGADRVSEETITNAGRALFARPILVNRRPGVVVAPLGRLHFVLEFEFDGDLISEINVVSETHHLHQLELAVVKSTS